MQIEDEEKVDPPEIRDQIITNYEIVRQVAPLGFLAYGGPMAHVAMIKTRFVDKNKWLSEQEFTELFSICQTLPGPTSTQLIIAIGTLASRSWKGGILAFILFSAPSAIFMLIAGLLMSEKQNNLGINKDLQSLFIGFQISAIAIVGQAAFKLFQTVTQERFCLILWGASVVIYLILPYNNVMIALIFAGAFSNILYKRFVQSQYPLPVPNVEQDVEFENSGTAEIKLYSDESFMGLRSIVLYALIFLILKILSLMFSSINIAVADGFYTMGSLIIGGGHVVLPMILTRFEGYGLITKEQFWNGIICQIILKGFSLVSCMPGPMFNISIYVGAIIGGLYTGIIAWIALFLPAFFVIWGLMPYWQIYRKKIIFQQIIQGISAVAVGFVATAVIQMLITTSDQIQVYIVAPLALLAYFLLEYGKIQAPFVVIGGGLIIVLYGRIVDQT